MKIRIGVLLSGCGALDGSGLHEAVFTLLALDRMNAEAICTALSDRQHHVLNHLNQEVMDESRSMLVESARISMGNIMAMEALEIGDLDGVIIPGGYGTVKSLCDFALAGPSTNVHPVIQQTLEAFLTAKKPIGAIGIASVLLVGALRKHHLSVTIGKDKGIASAIETMGGIHYPCSGDEIHVDNHHKIVTTPAFMIDNGPNRVFTGVERLVHKVVELTR